MGGGGGGGGSVVEEEEEARGGVETRHEQGIASADGRALEGALAAGTGPRSETERLAETETEREQTVRLRRDLKTARDKATSLRAELVAAKQKIAELELEVLRGRESSAAADAAAQARRAELECVALQKDVAQAQQRMQQAMRAAALRQTDLGEVEGALRQELQRLAPSADDAPAAPDPDCQADAAGERASGAVLIGLVAELGRRARIAADERLRFESKVAAQRLSHETALAHAADMHARLQHQIDDLHERARAREREHERDREEERARAREREEARMRDEREQREAWMRDMAADAARARAAADDDRALAQQKDKRESERAREHEADGKEIGKLRRLVASLEESLRRSNAAAATGPGALLNAKRASAEAALGESPRETGRTGAGGAAGGDKAAVEPGPGAGGAGRVVLQAGGCVGEAGVAEEGDAFEEMERLAGELEGVREELAGVVRAKRRAEQTLVQVRAAYADLTRKYTELGRQHVSLRAALSATNTRLDILAAVGDNPQGGSGEGAGEAVKVLQLYHKLLQEYEEKEAECVLLRSRVLEEVRHREARPGSLRLEE